MPDAVATEAIPLTSLVQTVWRHRQTAAVTLVAVTVLVILVSFLVTPLYRAEALLVVQHPDKISAIDPTDSDDQAAVGSEYSLLNTQSELLMSHEVIQHALNSEAASFDASPAYAKSKDRPDLMLNRLKVDTNQFSWVIHVAFVDNDPDLAIRGLTALLNSYLESERQRTLHRSQGLAVFLGKAVIDAQKALADSRTAEVTFRRQHDILATDPDHNLWTEELEATDASRSALAADRVTSDSTLADLAACDAAPSPEAREAALLGVPDIAHDPLVMQFQQNLLTLTDRAFSLGQKYKPAHPQMLDLAKQIESAQSELTGAVLAARAALIAANQSLQRRQDQFTANFHTQQARLATYREYLIELQALTMATQSHEEFYQTLDRNMQEVSIAELRQQNDVSLADPPHVTSWPVNVRRSLFGLAGLFLGMIAAVGAALVAERTNPRIRHHEAVRQITQLPILGSIPHADQLLPPGAPGALVPTSQKPIDEAFRLLGSTIQLSRNSGESTRVIVVTSPGSADGRTTVAARLSLTLAASGSRVLLIDGDLRKPNLHTQFAITPEAGVSDLLEGREAVVVPTGYARLELLSAGAVTDHSLELPNSASFRDLIASFTDNNRFIIIDSPPLEFSEALVMAGVASDIIMVIREGYTAKSALRLAQLRLGPLQGKVLGLVINDDHEVTQTGRWSNARTISPQRPIQPTATVTPAPDTARTTPRAARTQDIGDQVVIEDW